MMKSFRLYGAERQQKVIRLLPNHVCAEGTVGTQTISFLTNIGRQIEHDGDSQHMVLTREFDKRLAIVCFDIRRVDNCQSGGGKPLSRYVIKDVERLGRGGLVVLIVCNEPPAKI